MSTALVHHDPVIMRLIQAGTALTEAKTIQQTKLILDVAAAAEIYAKRQKLGDDAEGIAHSIKIDALRQLGEMLKNTPKNEGAKGIGKSAVPKENRTPTLKDLNLDKKTSAVAQKLAELPDKAFEQVRDGHETVAKAIAAISETRQIPRGSILVPRGNQPLPEQNPDDCDERDMMIDALKSTVEHLTLENERLKNSLSAGLVCEEDQAEILSRLEKLTEDNRKIEILNRGLIASRDSHMTENASLKKQCAAYQRKIKALEKNA